MNNEVEQVNVEVGDFRLPLRNHSVTTVRLRGTRRISDSVQQLQDYSRESDRQLDDAGTNSDGRH
jgi:hypothetical protein